MNLITDADTKFLKSIEKHARRDAKDTEAGTHKTGSELARSQA